LDHVLDVLLWPGQEDLGQGLLDNQQLRDLEV
jgi:hypothetical protein